MNQMTSDNAVMRYFESGKILNRKLANADNCDFSIIVNKGWSTK